MADKLETERVDCTDCFALPGPDNTRIAYVKTGGGFSETWHPRLPSPRESRCCAVTVRRTQAATTARTK